jgi:hypothetical protein
MAARRGPRGWAALTIILVCCVGLTYEGGSQRTPGHGEAESAALPCTQPDCDGTMLLRESGDYVCDTNSAHKRPAGQSSADQ